MGEIQEKIKPQRGPQEKFLASTADIVIFGGSAGGGKSYALLLEPIRYVDNSGYGGVIFRKNSNQITAEGGLWDTSMEIYTKYEGAEARTTPSRRWIFPSGASVGFAHIERDVDVHSWQGTQICYIGFDELTHFTEYSFFYMLSRNRSTCGVKPCVRCTCNPDADSWVAKFIDWWIDQDTGYPNPDRDGKKRWFIRVSNTVFWDDTRQESIQRALDMGIPLEDAEIMPKSVAFIKSSLEDNIALMSADPSYKANLLALPEVEKERLLYGNWKIKPQAGLFFKRTQVELLSERPRDIISYCRAWDIAASTEDENGDPDFTAGLLMGKRENGTYVILDVINQRISAGEVEGLILMTSQMDRSNYGFMYNIHIPQDPAAAGKILANRWVNLLSGFSVTAEPVSGSKLNRAMPLASQWQNGFVQVMMGEWNEMYFNQMESFPDSKHDDMVDVSSDAFNYLSKDNFNLENLL